MSQNILIVEDEQLFAKNVCTYLDRYGYGVRVAESGEAALREFDGFDPDLVLLDYRLGAVDGLDVLSTLRKRGTQSKFVMMTGHGNVNVAVRAMKAGADDFLTKPVSLERIRRIVERILCGEPLEAGSDGKLTPTDVSEKAQLVGDSHAMRELRDRVGQIVAAVRRSTEEVPPPTLITGETGTGKEVVARLLHANGSRGSGPFVSVNCAAIPSHLVEAELFGFERGAFTDASATKAGLIETADGGVLFLDEVGDLDLSVQSKLLSTLEQRTVRRIGGLTERSVDVWVVSATNRPLEQLVSSEAFRPDLMYRLNVLRLETPSLADRDGDVKLLADYFLRTQSRKWKRPGLHLAPAAVERLQNHGWPGNVRELRNVIEQAALLCAGDRIDAEQLAIQSFSGPTGQSIELPPGGLVMEDLERELLWQALERTDWNITSAAELLGLSRDTLRYRIDKHNLSRSN